MNDFALQSLTLCKYNLCSLHFSMCHISRDPNKWKMDQKVMKNRHGWITCTKVSAPSKTFPQIILAFRETPFPLFCSGKNISLTITGFPTMGEPGGPPPPRPNSLGGPLLLPPSPPSSRFALLAIHHTNLHLHCVCYRHREYSSRVTVSDPSICLKDHNPLSKQGANVGSLLLTALKQEIRMSSAIVSPDIE